MSEFEWPRDEFGFRKTEREFNADERFRYEEYKRKQKEQELISREEARTEREYKQRAIDQRAGILQPMLERFVSRHGRDGTIDDVTRANRLDGIQAYRWRLSTRYRREAYVELSASWISVKYYNLTTIPKPRWNELGVVLRRNFPDTTVYVDEVH